MTTNVHPFRQFAMAVYQIEGVSPASILLQDRCSVDVNLLLLAAYVGAARGCSITGGDVAEAQQRIGRWQTDVVGPLRSVRRQLTSGPPPAPNPATARLRERVKALELDAEMVELDELALLADELGVPGATGSAVARATTAMNLVVHESAGRELSAEERGAVAVIADAAARHLDGAQ